MDPQCAPIPPILPRLRHALALWPPVTAAIWALYLTASRPYLTAHHVPGVLEGLAWASIPGLALAALAVLLWPMRRALSTVFRPRRNRIVTALLLAAFLPVGLFLRMPISALYGLLAMPPGSPALVLKLAVTCAAAYAVSCILISGVRRLWLRLALFILVWWAFYAGHVLTYGIYTQV